MSYNAIIEPHQSCDQQSDDLHVDTHRGSVALQLARMLNSNNPQILADLLNAHISLSQCTRNECVVLEDQIDFGLVMVISGSFQLRTRQSQQVRYLFFQEYALYSK